MRGSPLLCEPTSDAVDFLRAPGKGGANAKRGRLVLCGMLAHLPGSVPRAKQQPAVHHQYTASSSLATKLRINRKQQPHAGDKRKRSVPPGLHQADNICVFRKIFLTNNQQHGPQQQARIARDHQINENFGENGNVFTTMRLAELTKSSAIRQCTSAGMFNGKSDEAPASCEEHHQPLFSMPEDIF